MDEVRNPRRRRRGVTRITVKHQATIPVDALREAGMAAGDDVAIHADGAGRIVLERLDDPFARAGAVLADTWPRGALAELEELRREWR